MRGVLILVLVTMFLTMASPIKISPAATIPPLYPGEENVTISVVVTNEGSESYKNMKAYLILEKPFFASKEGSDEFYLGDLDSRTPKQALFQISVLREAKGGDYEIPIVVKNERFEFRDFIKIRIVGETLVDVIKTNISGDVQPNKGFEIVLIVKNLGDNDLKWLRVSIASDVFLPDSSVMVFENVKANSSVQAKFFLFVGDVAPQNYPLTVNLAFVDEFGREFQDSEIIGIKVTGEAKLDIARKSTEPLRVIENSPFTLTLKIENTGTKDAKGVKLVLNSIFEGEKEVYLGTIKRNDYANAIFVLNSKDAGEVDVKLKIIHEEGSTEKSFTILVEKAEAKKSYTPYIVLGIALIVFLAIAFRVKR